MVIKMILCKHYIYLLKSESTRRTYIGYTVDLERRLRQHNGEITGGAKYTRYGRPWSLVLYVTGFPDMKTALQYEWRCHHLPKNIRRKGIGVPGRIKSIQRVLDMDQVTTKAMPRRNLRLMMVRVDPRYHI